MVTLVGTLAAQAQAQAPTPQQRYERELAYCNSGKLPDPQRDSCVRAAGLQLDKALGGTPQSQTVTSDDGRATIVSPAGLPPPDSGSNTVTSPSGRSTIVLPAISEAPPPGSKPAD